MFIQQQGTQNINQQELPVSQSSQSEEQDRRMVFQTQQKFMQQYQRAQDKRDFLVNAGFNFDITDYFKFQKKDQLKSENSFFKHLSQKSYLAWIVLLYSVCSSAMIPPWLMSIRANKLLRISWRCLLQLVIITPFVLFEYRTGGQKVRSMYELSHIMKPENIKKMCIAAFQGTFWVTAILTTIEWTYISHSMVLGSMANFFLSIERTIKGTNGHMEKGGQVFILLGIFLVFYDSATLIVADVPPQKWNVYNPFYLTREWWQRVLGDVGAISIAYCMSQISKQTSDIKQRYPPYLAMFLNNSLTCVFVIMSAFFFNGATFDADDQNGVFGLIKGTHFTNFLYMSIVLGMGVFISFVMVSKLFPDPIVPALAMTLEPIISTLLFHLVGVQTMPGSIAIIGYTFIVPGIIVILLGNCLYVRNQNASTLLIERFLQSNSRKSQSELNIINENQSLKK